MNSTIVLLQFKEDGSYEWFKTINALSNGLTPFGRSIQDLVDGDNDEFYAVGNINFNGVFDNDTVLAANGDIFLAKVSCKPVGISAILGDTIVCAGQEVYSLAQTKFGPGIDYQWTISGGVPFTQSDTFITVN